MPNTNFQTIHQMGRAINSFVKQATGRENVQNIDMEHITVAQNHYYEDVDISGRVVSFNAGAGGIPLEKCLVQIAPVQDLHGYDHPWPAGGGKNLLNPTGASGTDAGVTYTKGTDGKWTSSGTATGTSVVLAGEFDVKSGVSYTLNGCPSGGGPASYRIDVRTAPSSIYNDWIDIGSGMAFTPSEDAHLYVYIRAASGTNMEGKTFSPMIRLSSVTDATFAPYSNICPISGWTKAKVFVSPTTDEADGTTYTIAFPAEAGTVYGGTLDVTTGELVVDRTMVDFETITWKKGWGGFYDDTIKVPVFANVMPNIICSVYETKKFRGMSDLGISVVYGGEGYGSNGNIFVKDSRYSDVADFKAAMSGAQIVYELDTPVTYQLTPQEVSTLLGQNNIWADTGDIEVKFKNIKEFF